MTGMKRIPFLNLRVGCCFSYAILLLLLLSLCTSVIFSPSPFPFHIFFFCVLLQNKTIKKNQLVKFLTVWSMLVSSWLYIYLTNDHHRFVGRKIITLNIHTQNNSQHKNDDRDFRTCSAFLNVCAQLLSWDCGWFKSCYVWVPRNWLSLEIKKKNIMTMSQCRINYEMCSWDAYQASCCCCCCCASGGWYTIFNTLRASRFCKQKKITVLLDSYYLTNTNLTIKKNQSGS